MKHTGSGIIELSKKHLQIGDLMLCITASQSHQNDNQVSKSIKKILPDSICLIRGIYNRENISKEQK